MFQAIDLYKEFRGPEGTLEILRGVNLTIQPGELVFIFGRSGAGKSTLLHIFGGLDQPTRGKVIFDGREISLIRDGELSRIRNLDFGFVFQFYHLLPELTVEENVALPGIIEGKRKKSRVEMLLKRVGLWERRKHLPREISGGEQQRAAIARALVNEPRIVFCDEPTGNLDEETAESVQRLIFELNQEGQTFCIVTHEPSFVRPEAKAYRLHEGALEPFQKK